MKFFGYYLKLNLICFNAYGSYVACGDTFVDLSFYKSLFMDFIVFFFRFAYGWWTYSIRLCFVSHFCLSNLVLWMFLNLRTTILFYV